MIVFLNGQFVSDEQATVSVFDRSFLYGDGLFETIPVYAGRPFRWAQHLERLARGAEFLKMRMEHSPKELRKFAGELIERNQAPYALIRLTLSRGVGERGYSPKGADSPMIVMALYPTSAPDPQNPVHWSLVTSSYHLPTTDPRCAALEYQWRGRRDVQSESLLGVPRCDLRYSVRSRGVARHHARGRARALPGARTSDEQESDQTGVLAQLGRDFPFPQFTGHRVR